MGALVTAYLMMNNDMKFYAPYRAVKPPQLTNEAGVDPALNSLFEVEKGLGNISDSQNGNKRVPTQMLSRKKNQKYK